VRLLLVRHGESICSVDGIVGGEKGCTGLTERGFSLARALADRFEREGFGPDVVLASTLPRAAQTGATIAERLGAPLVPEPALREFVPGEIDGTPWAEFEGFDVLSEPDRPISPGGESLHVFRSRVQSLLDKLAAEHDGQTVVAACHGGIIIESIVRFFEVPNSRPLRIEVDFTSITEWTVEDEAWTLVRFNDVAHLMSSDLLAAR
jgi:broad specificity phosphatase PhoE